MTKVCCICKRTMAADSWVADEPFDERGTISHGYCSVCFDGVMVEIEDFMLSRRGVSRVNLSSSTGNWI